MRRYLTTLAALAVFWAASAEAVPVRLTVTNNGPTGGVFFTPIWLGFHNGSFDSYDGGTASAPEFERLAEDGNTVPLSTVFLANGTLAPSVPPAAPAGTRIDTTLGAGPVGPGSSVSTVLDLLADGSNDFLSYAAMVLPSNDYSIANDNPVALSLTDLLDGLVDSLVINIGLPGFVNDAGTEVNDFDFSAGNPLFPGLPPGQTGPDQGADEGGVNTNVANPYAGFLNTPGAFDFGPLNFNDTSLYPNGIATILIERQRSVPEPSTLGLTLGGTLLLLLANRRRTGTRSESAKSVSH